MMECEEARDQIEAYALGAVERKEARRLESHLKSCPECRSRSEEAAETVGLLGLSVPLHRADPSLRSRLLARIGVRADREEAVRPGLPAWGMRAFAFASPVLAVVVLGLLAWTVLLQGQMSDLRGDNDRLAAAQAEGERGVAQVRQELAQAVEAQQSMFTLVEEQRRLATAVLDPQAQEVELTASPEHSSMQARYVWSPQYETGVLLANNLPILPLDLTYQLWLVQGEQMTPVGTFRPLSDGTARLVIDDPHLADQAEKLVITVEPPGGSETRSGFSVLEGGITQ
jgi:anti-sigma-K factor RskA